MQTYAYKAKLYFSDAALKSVEGVFTTNHLAVAWMHLVC